MTSKTSEAWTRCVEGAGGGLRYEYAIIADFASCEKERDEHKGVAIACEARAEKAEAENRKLIANIEVHMDTIRDQCEQMHEDEGKIADLSQRLEQMRALGNQWKGMRQDWPKHCGETLLSALSTPPGELAREVREVMDHVAEFLHHAQGNHTVNWAVVEEVDALRAKMGGEK